MSNNDTYDADWAAFRRRFYTVAAIVAALLALLWLLGYGPGGSACKASVTMAAAPAAAPAPAPAPAVAPAPVAAPVAAASPTPTATAATAAAAASKLAIYFDVGKADLPADTDKALADTIAQLKAKADAKVQLSGFHDPSGNQAQNEELALNRARAVRAALEAAGISRDRVVMAKPTVTTGSGDAREARRVEVTVQ